MPAPSKLSIATSSLRRLVKEEASYHKELEQQEARVKKLEEGGGDENAEYQIKQERKAIEETNAVFPQLKQKITNAITQLEMQLEGSTAGGSEGSEEEITKAKEVLVDARKVVQD